MLTESDSEDLLAASRQGTFDHQFLFQIPLSDSKHRELGSADLAPFWGASASCLSLQALPKILSSAAAKRNQVSWPEWLSLLWAGDFFLPC